MKQYLLANERIGIRGILEEDINQTYCSWLNDMEVNQYMQSRYAPWDIGRMKAYLDGMSAYEYVFAICLLENNQHIGNIKLGPVDWINRRAEVSILLGEKAAWGKGYGSSAVGLISRFAFETLSLNKLNAGCYGSNIASKKIFLKNGYKEEGFLREEFSYCGRFENAYRFGLLRKEYMQGE